MRLSLLTGILFFLTPNMNAQTGEWIVTGITDTVLSITVEGNRIWVATQNAGVKYFDKTSGEIKSYNVDKNDFTSNKFRSVRKINATIYAGTYDDGFYIRENNDWIHYDTTNSELPGNDIAEFEYDSLNNCIWVATDKGLVKVEDDTWTVYDSLNSELAGNWLTSLYLDSQQTLWIGTRFAGMSKFADDVFTTYNYNNAGLNDNWVRTMIADTSGIMYVADYFGVDKYDPVEDVWLYVFNTTTSGLTNNQVNRMVFDATHHLWFATHAGVTRWDMADNWEQFYAENSPLPHNTTDALLSDHDGIVWIGSFGGLIGYNVNDVQLPDYGMDMDIYPNPVREILHADLMNITSVSISDMLGRVIYSQSLPAGFTGEFNLQVDLSGIKGGIYFLEGRNESETRVIPFILK